MQIWRVRYRERNIKIPNAYTDEYFKNKKRAVEKAAAIEEADDRIEAFILPITVFD